MSSPTRPESELDMDYDPEEDADEGSDPSHSGPTMLWFGFVAMGVVALWDYLAATPPSDLTYAILGVWLMLGTCVAMTEVIYR